MVDEKITVRSGRVTESSESTSHRNGEPLDWSVRSVTVTISNPGRSDRVAVLNQRLQGKPMRMSNTSR